MIFVDYCRSVPGRTFVREMVRGEWDGGSQNSSSQAKKMGQCPETFEVYFIS